jgi:hypothetical protein
MLEREFFYHRYKWPHATGNLGGPEEKGRCLITLPSIIDMVRNFTKYETRLRRTRDVVSMMRPTTINTRLVGAGSHYSLYATISRPSFG